MYFAAMLLVAAPFVVYGQAQRPACSLTSTPSFVRPNEQLVLEWNTRDAASGTLFGIAISPIEEGKRSFGGYSSEGPRTVTLFVRGDGGSNQCSAKIEVKKDAVASPAFTVRLPAKGSYQTGDDVDISWEYPNSPVSTRVYLKLVDLDGQDVASSSIAVDLAVTSGYTWRVSDKLGSTTIPSGQYKIRAVAYTGSKKESARSESEIIALDTRASNAVAANLANTLSALEFALKNLIHLLDS